MNISMRNIVWLLRRERYEHRRLLLAALWLGIAIVVLNLVLLFGGTFFNIGSTHGISIGGVGDTTGVSIGGVGHTNGISIGGVGDTNGLRIGGVGGTRGANLGSSGFFAELSGSLSHMNPHDMAELGRALVDLLLAILALFAIALACALFSYGVTCLFDERRDRSILFWKSLPVGDGETVIAKAVFALLALPIVWLVAAVITSWLAMTIYLAVLLYSGASLSQLFVTHHPLATTLIIVAAMPIYLLTLLPAVGWAMLCSASARRHPAMIALGVPALFALLGLFGLHNPVWNLLVGALVPTVLGQALFGINGNGALASALVHFYAPLSTFDFWLGIVFGVLCLVAAALYRKRYTTLV